MKNQRKNYAGFFKISGFLLLLGMTSVGFCSEIQSLPESRVHMGINVDLKEDNASDTTVIGSQIILESGVSGDFNALGENISVSSPVQGDFEVIGNRISINSVIEGEPSRAAVREDGRLKQCVDCRV